VSNGAAAASTNGTVTVTEFLPSGVTLAGMAGSGWTCSGSTCTRADALGGGSSYPPIAVTVNVGAVASGQFTNQVTVSGGSANTAGAEDLTIVTGTAASASVRRRR
jgi:hypothetical protein